MASYLLRKESKQILEQFGVQYCNEKLVCPILKVLQMRHRDLDIHQAIDVIRELIEN
ncbi:hypothetical protein [Sulfurovum sp.]|jgi:hypothetical protein|uniref:hypothetical protein n=1 Tax=Sulfurovum sp. TaxID=1969726 RepID=UPI002A35D36C|nr:hypothetical protein [Sulfurovum sp.]MDY0403468.1 hypothetical protein [Sulfurovum sp.]